MRSLVPTTSKMAVWGLAWGLVTSGCGAGRSPADLSLRYFSVQSALQGSGMAPVGGVSRGQLAQGQAAKLALDLGASCVTVVGMGGGEAVDVELSLAGPDGAVVARDTMRGPDATVRYCPEKPGRHELTLRMTEGSGAYLLATWSGGEGVPVRDAGAGPGGAQAGAGTCQSPILVAPGQSYVGDSADGRALEEGTCGNTNAREVVYRLDLPTRQRVVVDVTAQFDSVVYVRRGECGDRDAEVACNDDTGNSKHSRIDEVFDPGVYFVFVDGYNNEEGGFRMTTAAHPVPSASDSCRAAPLLASTGTSSGSLAGAADRARASCGRDARGPDSLYRLELAARSRVRIAESARGFSPVLHLRTRCGDEASEIACRDSGASPSTAAVVRLLEPGTYWVTADSAADAPAMDFSLRTEIVSEAGGSEARADSCGDAESLGAMSGQVPGDTFAARDDLATSCGASGAPDVVYRLDLGRRSRLWARIAADEARHVLALQRSCGARASEVGCGSSVDKILEPGTWFLVAESASAESFGAFRLAYRIEDLAGAQSACKTVATLAGSQPVASSTVGQGNRFTLSCAGSPDAQDSPDRVYKLTLAKRSTVRLTLMASSFAAVLSLRRACAEPAAEIGCSASYSPGSRVTLARALDPGTYWVIVDGRGAHSEGDYQLAMEVREEGVPKKRPR